MDAPPNPTAVYGLLAEALALPDDAARARWLAALPPELAGLKPVLERALAQAATTVVKGDPGPEGGSDAGATVVLTEDERPRGDFTPGQRFARWQLVREIGRGGMGVVWRGETVEGEGGTVALKFPAVSLHSAAFLERFERERDFLARLDHPHIARLVDAGVGEGGQQYLALEYVQGQPLDDYCDDNLLGIDERLRLFLQVLRAVDHAHERSVLHRDLKPPNILVTPAGAVRLLDFGVAKLMVDGQAEETALTRQWGRALTLEYASPEQVAGGTVTVASDIYTLGVILCELVCGRRPAPATVWIEGPDPIPPSAQVQADAVVAKCEGGATALARRLARGLDSVVVRALQSVPQRRYPSVAAMAADIIRVLSNEPIGSWQERWRLRAGVWALRYRASVSLSALSLLAVALLAPSHRLAADIESLLTPAPPPEQRVVLVTIGPDDHQRLFGGKSPLDPATVSTLVSRVLAGKPQVLGVDLDTSAPAYASWASTLDSDARSRVVWGRDIELTDVPGAVPVPRPVLGGAAGAPLRSGVAVSLVEGSSGTVRWFQRAVKTAEGTFPTLAGEISRSLRPDDGQPETALRSIRYARVERVEIPASVVMADGFQWNDRIASRIVVLGGRYDRTDLHATPLGLQHGIEIVAGAVETEWAGRAHPRPTLGAVFGVGALDVAAAVVCFARWPPARAWLASLLFGLALATLLALTGWMPAWAYAVLAALVASSCPWLVSAWPWLRAKVTRLWRARRANA